MWALSLCMTLAPILRTTKSVQSFLAFVTLTLRKGNITPGQEAPGLTFRVKLTRNKLCNVLGKCGMVCSALFGHQQPHKAVLRRRPSPRRRRPARPPARLAGSLHPRPTRPPRRLRLLRRRSEGVFTTAQLFRAEANTTPCFLFFLCAVFRCEIETAAWRTTASKALLPLRASALTVAIFSLRGSTLWKS